MSRQIYILCPFAKDSALYSGWSEQLNLPCQLVPNYRTDWQPPEDAALVISHMHYRYEECHILRNIVAAGKVPVLILADGILEHRNTWENPEIADASLFQPVIGHKIACIGRAQARILESWGNIGKCEIVGMPRFDQLVSEKLPSPKRDADEPFRPLIATATTPYFTEEQKETTVRGLRQLKNFLFSNSPLDGCEIKPTWRLNEELDELLNVKSDNSTDFIEAIEHSDALIVTPSTLILEGALKRRPVAALDYHRTPPYVPTAWTISASGHLPQVISELINPPQSKLLFQEAMLHDQLCTDGESSKRMIELVNSMSALANDTNSDELKFPDRIICDPKYGLEPIPESFNLQKLYPENDTFRILNESDLRVELAQARLRLEQLPDELLENREYIRFLVGRIEEVRSRLQRRNSRVWELRKQVEDLEKELQLLKEQSTPSVKQI